MVAIVLICDFIFMFLGLDLVLYIVGYLYVLYVTLSRLICPIFSVWGKLKYKSVCFLYII